MGDWSWITQQNRMRREAAPAGTSCLMLLFQRFRINVEEVRDDAICAVLLDKNFSIRPRSLPVLYDSRCLLPPY
jgi:hypothetical protein